MKAVSVLCRNARESRDHAPNDHANREVHRRLSNPVEEHVSGPRMRIAVTWKLRSGVLTRVSALECSRRKEY